MKDENLPSLTALFSAAARAAHPLVDEAPHLIDDPLALALCRTRTPSPLDHQLHRPAEPMLSAARLSACVRSRATERALAASGSCQYLVLGAGLDTSAQGQAGPGRLRTWLVDRPEVLRWRAGLFERAGLEDTGTHVPADLGEGIPFDGLRAGGLDPDRPVLVSWLGVSMYLDAPSNGSTLRELAGLASGSEIVFDYVASPEWRDERGENYARGLSEVAGGAGEPWLTTPAPGTVRSWLAGAGWTLLSDLAEAEAVPAGFWPRGDALEPMGLVRIAHARLDAPA